ncbi:MAG: TIGR03663 family protein [Thermoanaerobaculum sp.]|nr:TIGR03663 family protein [Thermoanaerobaculum sp.]MDW7967751.1 TIGR03663 family protein [Thermoanaerobaculum sp.]
MAILASGIVAVADSGQGPVGGGTVGNGFERWKNWLRTWWAWVFLGLVAAALRFFLLGDRPPHHDEAIHGHFAWELLNRHSYRYDPTYHGPLQYFILAGLFALFGEGEWVLRSYAAVCGTLLALVPLLLRGVVGTGPALAMGWLLALSPTFLYFSRFARNDVPVCLYTAVALVVLWRPRNAPGSALPWAGFFLGLHAISKETIYVTAALWALAALVLSLWQGLPQTWAWLRQWCWHERKGLFLSVAVFSLVCLVFYTVFFSWPQDVLFPLKAISYWYGQHVQERVGGPWYFYLPRLALYEFLIFGLAGFGVWRRWNRWTGPERFALLWGAFALGMYAYLGEKVPWLAVHQILPWVPLAGVELAWIWQRRGFLVPKLVVGGALVATFWSALASSYLYPTIEPTEPHGELLVFVQTTRAFQRVAEEGQRLVERAGGKPVALVEGEASWPLSWQWKRVSVQWGIPAGEALPFLVVADPGQVDHFPPPWKEQLRCENVPLRAWWVEEWQGVSPGAVLRWFFSRQAWSPRGSTDVQVCRLRMEGGGH